ASIARARGPRRLRRFRLPSTPSRPLGARIAEKRRIEPHSSRTGARLLAASHPPSPGYGDMSRLSSTQSSDGGQIADLLLAGRLRTDALRVHSGEETFRDGGSRTGEFPGRARPAVRPPWWLAARERAIPSP